MNVLSQLWKPMPRALKQRVEGRGRGRVDAGAHQRDGDAVGCLVSECQAHSFLAGEFTFDDHPCEWTFTTGV